MANNTLRMSGLNSGLDTEAIVNALTAATKNKINKNQRSILKLQAQQDAYRTIIDKFNAFKSKYFDILNVNTCLKSKTLFGSFKSTLTSSTGTDFVPGVTVSSSTTANEATYNVEVKKVATQSTYKSSNETGKAMDFSACRDNDKEYTMKVSVGSKSTYVTFKGGSDEQIREQINDQLADAFGRTNDNSGIVSIGEDNKLVSTDKSSVVTTSPTLYSSSRDVDLNELGGLQSGNNSFTITVNGVSKTVSFSTLSEDYFDDIFEADGNTLKSEEDMTKEQKEKLALYKQVVSNQRDGQVYDSFKNWWAGASESEKQAFAEKIAGENYKAALEDINKDFDNSVEAKAKLHALAEYQKENAGATLQDYLDSRIRAAFEEEKANGAAYTEEDYEAYAKEFKDDFSDIIADYKENDAEGYEALEKARQDKVDALDKMYNGYTDGAKEAEINAAYDKQFEAAKEAAWKAANGNAEPDKESDDYKNFSFTKEDFEAYTEDEEGNKTYTNSYYNAYLTDKTDIEDKYAAKGDDYHSIDLDKLSESQLASFYDEYFTAEEKGVADEEEFLQNYADYMGDDAKSDGMTAAREAVYQFNKSNIENNLEDLYFITKIGGVDLEVDFTRDGKLSINSHSYVGLEGDNAPKFSITANANSTNTFGFDTTDVSGTASQVSTTSKLNELGLEPDKDGNYSFSINGVSFTFSGDTTISDMMKKVSASEAGVSMSYTTLTNQFILTSKEYGTGVDINFQDGGQGLLSALGFGENREAGIGTFTEGHNTELNINGVDVETTSNSYTVDGTTFTFTQAAVGQTFTNEVTRDYSKAMDVIKSFVEDYNKLIDDIYGYVDEEPNDDYYFLTDDDIDEMGLSETQQAKWEKMAQKGLLYRDSTLTDIMSKLRTVIYNTVDAADGSKVGLYTLGITTSSDYANHGKLVFDDTKDFAAIFEKYADEFTTLFTDSEKGIATQLENIINNATRTTGGPGERGSLVDKAGVSGTSSATSNTIYNKIKSLQDVIASLQRRYEQQQDRYWKIYGNMETMLGNLNGQTSYINQLLGNF